MTEIVVDVLSQHFSLARVILDRPVISSKGIFFFYSIPAALNVT